MAWFQVQLLVSLKEGLLDPQGKAIEGALPALGWDNVGGVGVGKYLHFDVDADGEEAARQQVHQMAERFLTNPVIEDYAILDVRGDDAEEPAPAAEGTSP
jgi:phosphoribosylformylglycinamidine synthase PurS subunit